MELDAHTIYINKFNHLFYLLVLFSITKVTIRIRHALYIISKYCKSGKLQLDDKMIKGLELVIPADKENVATYGIRHNEKFLQLQKNACKCTTASKINLK